MSELFQLKENETLIAKSSADRTTDSGGVQSGTMYLTNQRLVFCCQPGLSRTLIGVAISKSKDQTTIYAEVEREKILLKKWMIWNRLIIDGKDTQIVVPKSILKFLENVPFADAGAAPTLLESNISKAKDLINPGLSVVGKAADSEAGIILKKGLKKAKRTVAEILISFLKRIQITFAYYKSKDSVKKFSKDGLPDFSDLENYIVFITLIPLLLISVPFFPLLLISIPYLIAFLLMGVKDPDSGGLPGNFRKYFLYRFFGYAFNWRGEVGRKSFWKSLLYYLLISSPFVIFTFEREAAGYVSHGLIICLIHFAIFVAPSTSLFVRRLRGAGKKPEWVLLITASSLGSIFFDWYFFFFLQAIGVSLVTFWCSQPSSQKISSST